MSSSSDDTILPPPRRPINSSGLDGDTVLPNQNTARIHVAGDVIHNRYTVVREIGRGGMGVVYEVLDAITGDHYAIKRLLPDYIERSDIVELFRTEGAASMRFTTKSQRFVTTQIVDLDGGIPYIVLQLIRLPTLRVVIQQAGGHLSVDVALPILIEVATALKELHGFGYVHRDLKPENIFVDSTVNPPAVLLVDFGLTKDDSEGTRTNIRGAGTSGYASPEQRKGLPTTPATDIYAFGVIAYEMLTGELPSIGDLITDYVSDVPKYLVDLIVQCQATRPERRLQDGAGLLDVLTKSQTAVVESKAKDEPLASTPSPIVEQAEVHTGTLVLSGVPDEARVFIDGDEVHGTYHRRALRSESQHVTLTIRCEGYVDYVRSIILNASTIADEKVQMERIAVKRQHRLAEFPHLGRYVHSMCQIPAGTFQMGSVSGSDNEKPVHSVSLSSFWLGATPVTVAMWKEYCVATGTTLPPAPSWGLLDDHPVVNVSWNDIMGAHGKGGFGAWASEIVGGRLTLPTEAQFEYATRGGRSGLAYPWGDTFDKTKLWCSNADFGDTERTAPVVRSSNIFRNAYGLTDMVGNVYQWCSDWYGPYGSASENDPKGTPSSTDNVRCVRGGSWFDYYPGFFRCAYRKWLRPGLRNVYIGFRLSAGPS